MNKFRVGDQVRAKYKTKPCWHFGFVIAINPDDGHYLVDFPNFTGGGGAKSYWHYDWYPKEHKTFSNSRYWCDDRMIDFADEPASQSIRTTAVANNLDEGENYKVHNFTK